MKHESFKYWSINNNGERGIFDVNKKSVARDRHEFDFYSAEDKIYEDAIALWKKKRRSWWITLMFASWKDSIKVLIAIRKTSKSFFGWIGVISLAHSERSVDLEKGSSVSFIGSESS